VPIVYELHPDRLPKGADSQPISVFPGAVRDGDSDAAREKNRRKSRII
jgi:hypothetical protein